MGCPVVAVLVPEKIDDCNLPKLQKAISREAKVISCSADVVRFASGEPQVQGSCYVDQRLSEYSRSCLMRIDEVFGVRVANALDLGISAKPKPFQMALARVAEAVASEFGGVIDFCGALIPRSAMPAARTIALAEGQNWADVSDGFEEFQRSMPGRLLEIPYETGLGDSWVCHYADVAFLRGWRRHSDFYLGG